MRTPGINAKEGSMSVQQFPAHFSLRSLRNQAKQLLKAQGNGDYDAWERIKALHPRHSRSLEWSSPGDSSRESFSLQDAQLVAACACSPSRCLLFGHRPAADVGPVRFKPEK
jgi:hypothetical protein